MNHLDPQLLAASADRAERLLLKAEQAHDKQGVSFWRQIRDQFSRLKP
jgi:hypothetical protein